MSFTLVLIGEHLEPAVPVITALVGRGLLDTSDEVRGGVRFAAMRGPSL